MKLKSIIGYADKVHADSSEFNIMIHHIVWYSKYDNRTTLVSIPSGETFLVHITLSEFKKILEA